MPGLLLAAMLATQAQSSQAMPNIVFARGHLDGWSMEATNVLDGSPSEPVINRMLCEIKRDGLRAILSRRGDISFIFERNTDRDRRNMEVRTVVIDDLPHEVELRPMGALSDRYTDVNYPRSQVVYGPSELSTFAIRGQGSELWLSLGSLDNELLEARRLRVGFQGAAGTPMQWIEVPMARLGGAIAWCQTAMTSPNALRRRPL